MSFRGLSPAEKDALREAGEQWSASPLKPDLEEFMWAAGRDWAREVDERTGGQPHALRAGTLWKTQDAPHVRVQLLEVGEGLVQFAAVGGPPARRGDLVVVGEDTFLSAFEPVGENILAVAARGVREREASRRLAEIAAFDERIRAQQEKDHSESAEGQSP